MTIKNLSHPRALDDYVIHIDEFELKKGEAAILRKIPELLLLS